MPCGWGVRVSPPTRIIALAGGLSAFGDITQVDGQSREELP